MSWQLHGSLKKILISQAHKMAMVIKHQDMIEKILYSLLFFSVTQFGYAQKQIEIFQPKGEFDIRMATEMLNEGNAEIKGTAYYEQRTAIGIKAGETIYTRMGTIVSLYPLTPYLEGYLELKKRNKEGKRLATITPLASSYRIESKIYSIKGEFVFNGLRPGKYYLESTFYYPSGPGGEVSGIVEIVKDGEVVDYKLKYIF
jgi:hypothetical protein